MERTYASLYHPDAVYAPYQDVAITISKKLPKAMPKIRSDTLKLQTETVINGSLMHKSKKLKELR
ncbi:MAG: hypothetical protein QXS49_00630 [Ferroplasma sp.]